LHTLFICVGEMNMSFLVAVPDLVQTAAGDLAGLRSALDKVSEAIAAPTTTLAPVAGDEISAAVVTLFRNFGEEYQALDAHASAFHEQFVQTLTSGASAYVSTEADAVQAMAAATPALGLNLGGGLSGVGLSGGLRGLEASLSAGLPGLLGVSVNVGVSDGLVGGLSRLVQTGESLVANLGAGLPGLTLRSLGADLGAVVNAELALPRLALDVFRGLPGLTLRSLRADLGAVVNAELALPRLALDVFTNLPGLMLPGLGVDLGALINAELALPRLALDLFVRLPALTLRNLALNLSLGSVA
jgi:hypothetical protein